MFDRIRAILGVSLAFNVLLIILAIFLFFRITAEAPATTNGGEVTEQTSETSVLPTATDAPITEPTATDQVSPTATSPAPTAVPSPTPIPTETSPLSPTDTPLPTETAPPSPTPAPTNTPVPTVTSTPVSIPMPDWLSYLNEFRRIGNLPLISESLNLTAGSDWHSSYMVVNDAPFAHNEDPENSLFNEIGDLAARKGNIFATSQTEAGFKWAINFWYSAPFHAVPMLDPQLETVGYGDHVEDVGAFKMAAVSDVQTGIGEVPDSVTYPLYFPGDGAQTWIARLSLIEWPDPYGSCPGYTQPTGPAIVMQLGPGDLVPDVTNFAFTRGEKVVDACLFDETTYLNSNPYTQDLGRLILDERDAIVVIPREQLYVDETYTVTIAANGQTYTWSFDVVKPPK